jgi:single-strand DNA-binding protein
MCSDESTPGAGAVLAEGRVMAGSLNKVLIIGNVGRDPEMRYAPSGSAVTTFSVAANRRWTGQDGQPQDETEWFSVVTWNKLAETCNQYLTKGRTVFVEGRLRTRSWDGQDGQKHYRTEVIAADVRFLDSNTVRAKANGSTPGAGLEDDEDVDDIPF